LYGSTTLLRHQADWINGWFLGDWSWGEEGNNLRLGWNLERECWPALLTQAPWKKRLPVIRASGDQLGQISKRRAKELGLPSDVQIIAGTTDSNAAVLATDPGDDDGITVLGTTLVMKRFTTVPIRGPGITSHRVGGRWLCGGASNAGAGVLRQFFNDELLTELSRQINPDTNSGLIFAHCRDLGNGSQSMIHP
jgi:sugar (pentulose or hexulose) kinase